MKTQLLQDFQESGSAEAAPKPADPPLAPARPARPAVWHGPGARRDVGGAAVQRADPGAMQRAPDTPARGLGVAIEAWAERAAQHRPTPPPAAPPIDEATVPGEQARAPRVPPPRPPEPAVPDPRIDPRIDPRVAPGFDPGTIPRPTEPEAEADWLAARLRDDATRDGTPAWSSVWKRRLVTWSIAGGLLAALAAGGLWLYEENRVDGALVVVANTSPAPAGTASEVQAFPAGSTAAVPAAPAPPPVAAEAVKPLPEPEVAPAPAPAPVADTPPPDVASRTVVPVDVNPPRRASHQASPARKRAAAKARHARPQEAPPVAATPSPRERREETLMQCRAHGYDERQCIQRACTMTRYGLACKG
jgi:hypothetical protein